jgi:hypothetical protein
VHGAEIASSCGVGVGDIGDVMVEAGLLLATANWSGDAVCAELVVEEGSREVVDSDGG